MLAVLVPPAGREATPSSPGRGVAAWRAAAGACCKGPGSQPHRPQPRLARAVASGPSSLRGRSAGPGGAVRSGGARRPRAPRGREEQRGQRGAAQRETMDRGNNATLLHCRPSHRQAPRCGLARPATPHRAARWADLESSPAPGSLGGSTAPRWAGEDGRTMASRESEVRDRTEPPSQTNTSSVERSPTTAGASPEAGGWAPS